MSGPRTVVSHDVNGGPDLVLHIGSVVQINPHCGQRFAGCFLTITRFERPATIYGYIPLGGPEVVRLAVQLPVVDYIGEASWLEEGLEAPEPEAPGGVH